MESMQSSTLFSNRLAPWSNLGSPISSGSRVVEALGESNLNWTVAGVPLYANGALVEGYQANVRVSDGQVLGLVSDRYQIIQNQQAFGFVDDLLSEGLQFVSGGTYQEGQRVWLLGKMPEEFFLGGDLTETYLLFLNSHDGSSSFKVALTPLRILCQNAINLGLQRASRVWSFMHTKTVQHRLQTAINTLAHTQSCLSALQGEVELLQRTPLSDARVHQFVHTLLPLSVEASTVQERNLERQRTDLLDRFYFAPDLDGMPKDGWRFINAVSDYVTHTEPLRRSGRYRENQFMKSVDGNPMLDFAVKLVKNAA